MKRHVKEQSALSCFPPSSPGSCLAHKESSKSPFLPTFLPLVLLLLLPKSQPPLFRPSFRVLLSHPHPFLHPNFSRAPLSRCSPRMLMHTRSATVLAGPPVLIRVLPDPLLYPVLPSLSRLSSPSLFVYLAKFDSPTRSDLTFRSLLVPRFSSLPRLSSYHCDSLRAGIFLLVSLLVQDSALLSFFQRLSASVGLSSGFSLDTPFRSANRPHRIRDSLFGVWSAGYQNIFSVFFSPPCIVS